MDHDLSHYLQLDPLEARDMQFIQVMQKPAFPSLWWQTDKESICIGTNLVMCPFSL
jgi:hypothetical protein